MLLPKRPLPNIPLPLGEGRVRVDEEAPHLDPLPKLGRGYEENDLKARRNPPAPFLQRGIVSRFQAEFLGTELPYLDAMNIMRREADNIRANHEAVEKLLLLEHRATITITRKNGPTHLLVTADVLQEQGIDLVETDRGGDITFHGPGQLVGYPLLRLEKLPDPLSDHAYNLLGYLRNLETALLRACHELGVQRAQLLPGFTGIWIAEPNDKWRKLVAIGVGVKGGVSQHGFALNINNDYQRFLRYMLPCGLVGKGVTNLAEQLNELGLPMPPMSEIRDIIIRSLIQQFDVPDKK